jgi:hypothetical protein
MHTGTRAVTWSDAAERKQLRNHPAHVDNHVRKVRGVWMIARECEWCGKTYSYPMDDFEVIGIDDRGIVGGICDPCQKKGA